MKLTNPTTLVVPLTFLAQTKKYKFNHHSNQTELVELQKILPIEKLLYFSFKGNLIQPKNKNYDLFASFKAIIIQNCVITWKPIKTIITNNIERCYKEEKISHTTEDIPFDLGSTDIESIQKELNIGDVILEALCLEIPDYPKKKNAQFKSLTITEFGMEPLDQSPNNPFSILKDISKK